MENKVETNEVEKEQSCPIAIIKRANEQDFRQYKELQSETNKMIRHFLKGILFHDPFTSGTYIGQGREFKKARYEDHKLLTHQRKCRKRRTNETK